MWAKILEVELSGLVSTEASPRPADGSLPVVPDIDFSLCMCVSSVPLCPLLGRHQYATLCLTTWPHYPTPLAERPPSKYNNLLRYTWASLVQKAPVPTLSQQNTKDQSALTILLGQYSDSPKLLTQKSRKAQTFRRNDASAHKHQHGWGTQALGLTNYTMNTRVYSCPREVIWHLLETTLLKSNLWVAKCRSK